MLWWIDNDGIHVNVQSLHELKEAVGQIERRLTSTPRSLQEQNDHSLRVMQRMVGGPGSALAS